MAGLTVIDEIDYLLQEMKKPNTTEGHNTLHASLVKLCRWVVESADANPDTPEPWVGFDLDGTLAHYEESQSIRIIGKPLSAMVEKLKRYRRAGQAVKIVTARVGPTRDLEFLAEQITLVEAWCLQYIGEILPVTATKDYRMLTLYDDRCVQVISNTGVTLAEQVASASDYLKKLATY